MSENTTPGDFSFPFVVRQSRRSAAMLGLIAAVFFFGALLILATATHLDAWDLATGIGVALVFGLALAVAATQLLRPGRLIIDADGVTQTMLTRTHHIPWSTAANFRPFKTLAYSPAQTTLVAFDLLSARQRAPGRLPKSLGPGWAMKPDRLAALLNAARSRVVAQMISSGGPASARAEGPPGVAARANAMQSVTTTGCRAHGRPEITIGFDASRVLEFDARFQASVLERMVAAGNRFEPGQLIQIGWNMARFVALPDGALGLEEPDMAAMPTVFQPGLTQTLRHLRLQKDTVESLSPPLTPAFPSLRQGCVVCSNLTPAAPLRMHRIAPSEAHSGWFMTCRDASHDHDADGALRNVSLYEAIVRICPRALAFLAFPVGSTIFVDDRPTFLFDGKPLEIRAGSFLDWLMRQSGNGTRPN